MNESETSSDNIEKYNPYIPSDSFVEEILKPPQKSILKDWRNFFRFYGVNPVTIPVFFLTFPADFRLRRFRAKPLEKRDYSSKTGKKYLEMQATMKDYLANDFDLCFSLFSYDLIDNGRTTFFLTENHQERQFKGEFLDNLFATIGSRTEKIERMLYEDIDSFARQKTISGPWGHIEPVSEGLLMVAREH